MGLGNVDWLEFVAYFYCFYLEICDGRALNAFVKDVFLLPVLT